MAESGSTKFRFAPKTQAMTCSGIPVRFIYLFTVRAQHPKIYDCKFAVSEMSNGLKKTDGLDDG